MVLYDKRRILLNIVSFLLVLFRHRTAQWIILSCFWAILMVSYIGFNIKFPFGCTMDFRYIVTTALIGTVFMAKGWEPVSKRQIGKMFRIAFDFSFAQIKQ